MNDFETVRRDSRMWGEAWAAFDRIEAEVERLRAENDQIRRDTRTMRESFDGLNAEVERLRAALEHGIIAYAGLKQFAEQQLGKPIQGGVWPDEARAALAKEGE